MLLKLFVFGYVAAFTVPGWCCRAKEYPTRDGQCCPKCHEGTKCRSCLPCLEGTYMNQPTERTQCFPCTNCDAGSGLKIKTSCTSTSDTVCEPLEGFYCMDVKDKCCMAAQRHKHCEPGQYISKKGWSSVLTLTLDCSFIVGTTETQSNRFYFAPAQNHSLTYLC
uniref:TNFR-Cys domain-containing protein n=1 Tax=Lates calcarifer TaxID=8187 RepID=A0A4W6D3J4_LATCA